MSNNDIFQENEKHPMKIETRDVKFSNDEEIDASKVDLSGKPPVSETINELKRMGVLDEQ